MRRDLDRFNNYRTIVARFDSIGFCGHQIKKGDSVGYNGKLKRVRCEACFTKWKHENKEAASYETFGTDCMYDC
jgi:hypothetical protein